VTDIGQLIQSARLLKAGQRAVCSAAVSDFNDFSDQLSQRLTDRSFRTGRTMTLDDYSEISFDPSRDVALTTNFC